MPDLPSPDEVAEEVFPCVTPYRNCTVAPCVGCTNRPAVARAIRQDREKMLRFILTDIRLAHEHFGLLVGRISLLAPKEDDHA